MKVEATVSFAGTMLSMAKKEQREVMDKKLLADLMNAGYLKEVKIDENKRDHLADGKTARKSRNRQ